MRCPNFLSITCMSCLGLNTLKSTFKTTKYPFETCIHSFGLTMLLTLVLLNPDIPCLCKQCRSRSVGFCRSQLIWIYTVCHSVCEFIATIQIKSSDWLIIRSGRGILIYSAGQGLRILQALMTDVTPADSFH